MIAASDYLHGLTVSHLMFTVRACESILLEGQPGSALRGALYEVLADNFCTEPNNSSSADHASHCPVCWLLAQERPGAVRGENIPRALTVQPPAPGHYSAGQFFEFGFTLIGAAQELFPYIARAVSKMGKCGVGLGRGRFDLISIREVSPLLDTERTLMAVGSKEVKEPRLQINWAQVQARANPSAVAVSLDFLTPVRLIANGKLVREPEPKVFMARLVERCQAIAHYYAPNNDRRNLDWPAVHTLLCEQATQWIISYNDTQWVEYFSGSRRQQRLTPISGLVGRVSWKGEIGAAHEWLLWGQSLHVGKDTVKGNGWYRVL